MSTTPKSTKSEIRTYQSQLQRGGFYWGAIDGIWGPITQRAHETYQATFLPAASAKKSDLKIVQDRILQISTKFVGLTESSPNAIWDDVTTAGKDAHASELRALLLKTGWQPGWAYCCSFAEVAWRFGYLGRPELALIGQAITPSVMSTHENFEELGRITDEPIPGAIMLMQKGKTWQGHAGIVASVRDDVVFTIEGNTSARRGSVESQRNGDGVFLKEHRLDFTQKSGLWIRGFVNPFLIK